METDEKPITKRFDNTSSAKRRGRTGHGSRNNHIDKMRLAKGAKFNQALDDAFDAKWSVTPEEIAKIKGYTLDAGLQERAVKLPVATRGVGILLAHTAPVFKHRANTVDCAFGFNINTAYRCSLLQLEQKRYKMQKQMFKSSAAQNERIEKPPVFEYNRNLAPIACIISEFGNFREAGVQYEVYVKDDSKIEYETPERNDQAPAPKEPRLDLGIKETSFVDPHSITIRNLRKVVENLSDPDVPISVRAKFRKNNPIPGAKWSADDLLTNPNEIMPKDYLNVGSKALAEDRTAFAAAIDKLGIAFPNAVREISQTGGSASQLVSIEHEENKSIRVEEEAVIADGCDYVRASALVSPNHGTIGHYTLLGELPPHAKGKISHALRHEQAAVRMTIDHWNNVANLLMP